MIKTAVILAGGLGTRLRPLTDTTPKPLLPIKGKPILQHIIENLKYHGVTNIILSIGYKAEIVQAYFNKLNNLGINLRYSIEPEPLGTGGAIKLASKELQEPFILLWGDNLIDLDLHALQQTHKKENALITMALTPREDVEYFGVAKLQNNKIISFVEKPKREEAPSNLINAGAFIVDPQALEILLDGKSSIEKECFELLAPQGKIAAYTHPGQWFPTDTLEKYNHANNLFLPLVNFHEKNVIIADVDETICESCQVISPEMAQQIDALIQKGYTFAFISGTNVAELTRMISSKVNQEHHLLATTGTNYTKVKEQNTQTIYNYSLTTAEKQEIKNAFEKLIAQYQIQSLTTTGDQIQDRDSQITLSAIGRNAPSHLKAAYDPTGAKRKEWVEFLKQYLDETKYDLKIGGTTSIDITKKGLDKEWGIRQFVQHNQIPFSSIVFLGDKIYPGGNDHPATKVVDCIAVKNPQDTLRKLKQFT